MNPLDIGLVDSQSCLARAMNPTKKGTILLIEDDPGDELLALQSFRKAHIDANVVVIRDGAEALDYLLGTGAYAERDDSMLPSRIFLDLNLPKINGLEVLKRIKQDERTKAIPVVALSGSDYEIISVLALSNGAEACFLKPLTCEILRQAT